MEKDKRKVFICSLIFNIVETALIFLVGKLLQLPTNYILMIMLCFLISRRLFGETLHYKTWYRCLIVSLTILLSLFVLLKVDLVLSFLFTILGALVMTGKGNINDHYLWLPKGSAGKYADIEEYVRYNETNSTLIEFETNLRRVDNLKYTIYKYRFKDGINVTEIAEKLDMANPRVVEKLDSIALAIRVHCGI